ncbi:hypothetical protein [Nocardia sp. NPDC004722]
MTTAVAQDAPTTETVAAESVPTTETESANPTREIVGCLVETVGPGVYEVYRAGVRLGGAYQTPQGVFYTPEIANTRASVADSLDVAVLELKRAIESAPAPKRGGKPVDPTRAMLAEITKLARVRFAAASAKKKAANAAHTMENGPRGKVALATAAVKRATDAIADKGGDPMRYFRLNDAESNLEAARDIVGALQRAAERAAKAEDQAKAALKDARAKGLELGIAQSVIDETVAKVNPETKKSAK